MSKDELPDLRDVHPDDPTLRAHIGLETEPGMVGEQVLLQACAQCHNARLDQTLSRARFTTDFDALGRAQKSLAITRISLPPDDPRAMPPPLARRLSDEGRERLIELLRR